MYKVFINFMKKNGIGFDIYCSHLINDFDTFVKEQSWHSSNFPYNLTKYIHTDCTFTNSLFKRVAWFSLSASLKKSHIKYIIQKLEEYKNEF